MDYKVFTRDHDEVGHIRDMAFNRRHDRALYGPAPETIMEECDSPKVTLPERHGPVTFLIDASGSQRGLNMAGIAISLAAIGDAMAEAGRPFEILAHTTTSWSGGKSREQWITEGRPLKPGRLSDLRLMIVKDLDEDWLAARDGLVDLMRPGLIKENVDGEAVEWAAGRIRDQGRGGALIAITDGAPCCDSTTNVNGPNYLEAHARAVIKDVSAEIPLKAIEIANSASGPVKDGIWPDVAIIGPFKANRGVAHHNVDQVSEFASELTEKLISAVREISPDSVEPAPGW